MLVPAWRAGSFEWVWTASFEAFGSDIAQHDASGERRRTTPRGTYRFVVTGRADMEAKLAALRPFLAPSGFIWVSWPKKASKVPTDITEDGIREAILPATDLVDVKVCAIDQVWSGLKLMIRRERR